MKPKLIILSVLLSMNACAVTPYNYEKFVANMPRSILVIPPLNHSNDVHATYSFLSTVSRPLAERGYYVFPVAVVDRLLKENGLPTPGEMRQIPLSKIDELLGADAVLYIDLTRWGSNYILVDSWTVVEIVCRLVDVKTGITIWAGKHSVSKSSAQLGVAKAREPVGLLIELMIEAFVAQVVNESVDMSRHVARTVNNQLFNDGKIGLLAGPRHPKHEEGLAKLRQEP